MKLIKVNKQGDYQYCKYIINGIRKNEEAFDSIVKMLKIFIKDYEYIPKPITDNEAKKILEEEKNRIDNIMIYNSGSFYFNPKDKEIKKPLIFKGLFELKFSEYYNLIEILDYYSKIQKIIKKERNLINARKNNIIKLILKRSHNKDFYNKVLPYIIMYLEEKYNNMLKLYSNVENAYNIALNDAKVNLKTYINKHYKELEKEEDVKYVISRYKLQ